MFLHFILCLFTLPRTMASPPWAEETFQGATTRAMSNIAKQGCPTQCGNVIVPYPFGIGNDARCSLDHSFYLDCNSSHKPPKLILPSSDVQIYNISDSELRVSNDVAYRCYDKNGSVVDETFWWINLETFTFSEKNKFTVIGCDDYASMTGIDDVNISNGCTGLCSKAQDVLDGQCSGVGCCQTPIRKGLKYYSVTLNSFKNHTDVLSFNRCGYAFLGEGDRFEFRGAIDIIDEWSIYERIRSTVPVVIDWVIAPERNCTDATECKENSSCYDVHGGGYHCKCNKGYEGNPYLDAGCKDINECEDPRNNTCFGDCTNTLGSYNCTCPPGFFGDAKTPNGCQPVAKDSKFPITIFTIVLSSPNLIGYARHVTYECTLHAVIM